MSSGKRTSRSSASQAADRQSGSHKTSGKKTARKNPIHREVGAFLCLFLGVFLAFGWFGVDGIFVKMLCSFARGLVGSGYYIFPLALFLGFWILMFHRGRPVRFRLCCAFLLPVFFGAIGQLLGKGTEPAWGFAMLGALYKGGIAGTTGGLIAGFFAQLFELIFSFAGALIMFILLFAAALLGALNMTVFSLIQAIRNRPRLAEYDPPEEEPEDTATVLVNHVANKRIERAEKRRVSDYDLPVDEPPMPVREAKTRRKKQVVSPDEFLMEKMRGSQTQSPPAQMTFGDIKPEPQPENSPEIAPVKPGRPDEQKQPIPEAFTLPPLEKPQEPQKLRPEEARQTAEEISREIAMTESQSGVYSYPPVSLLRSFGGGRVDGTEEMRENSERLNATLQSFNIEAHIVNVTRGPSVTRYELELDRGVKLSKVTNLADDIALSLGASGVRISAIPDKISVVGIEVPNRQVSTVSAKDVIDSPEFERSKSKISFAVGKDISGNRIVGDIAKLPHLLIAGTTGSGKSVCMNSLIISLLYKARPDEVRLIMVDPKMVELGIYNGIPHLLIPVVTDPKKAAGALQWAVTEMMRRYRAMADAGVRDLDSYNKAVATMGDGTKPMEQVVVVIDELADLMLVAAKEVEESICRIAQMGRASGIHLVIATQRPSADVITGLMKANIPSRIAFAVASAMESRIILDTQGAEKLVGKGDMLYAPLGQGKPKRVQGCFITDEEVQDVVSFIKKSSAPNYSEEVQAQIDERAEQGGKGEASAVSAEPESGDELLPAAVEVILETGQASVSMLQRRLKLGYARAARIVDEMEDRGIVGPFEGSKPRQLLITREQWDAMQNGSTATEADPSAEE